ncbi:MAG: hypothetical protein KDB23_02405 [Planctomycetales bacterium]|nr:hypothetical protein [Planctomycetales bacterium]
MVRKCQPAGMKLATSCFDQAIGLNDGSDELPPWQYPAHQPTLRYDHEGMLKYYDLYHVVLGRVEPRYGDCSGYAHNLAIAIDDDLRFISFTAQFSDFEDATNHAYGRRELFESIAHP